ncbi:hypothetical protein L1D58_19065 [Vibrio diabolicus]|nr:hypothetical protein [Vibrio diabolicus]
MACGNIGIALLTP